MCVTFMDLSCIYPCKGCHDEEGSNMRKSIRFSARITEKTDSEMKKLKALYKVSESDLISMLIRKEILRVVTNGEI